MGTKQNELSIEMSLQIILLSKEVYTVREIAEEVRRFEVSRKQ